MSVQTTVSKKTRKANSAADRLQTDIFKARKLIKTLQQSIEEIRDAANTTKSTGRRAVLVDQNIAIQNEINRLENVIDWAVRYPAAALEFYR